MERHGPRPQGAGVLRHGRGGGRLRRILGKEPAGRAAADPGRRRKHSLRGLAHAKAQEPAALNTSRQTPDARRQKVARSTASAAGLNYTSDARPGVRRRKRGGRYVYLDPRGATIRNPAAIKRYKALAVPPAYTDVWISADPKAHVQATGRDARGRKQYRYHPR